MFIGFVGDGSFYQVLRLPPEVKTFGPSAAAPPPDARHVLRMLDDSSGQMADSFIYFDDWAEIRGVDRGPAKYDPRNRSWYANAWKYPGTRISDVYVFSSSGKPGLTVSQRISTASGAAIDAIGADISLDTLSLFLAQKQMGENGRIFILDEQGHLIAHADPALAVEVAGGSVTLRNAADAADPVVAGAFRMHSEKGHGDQFTARLGPENEEYLVSFTPFPAEFSKPWIVGVAVPSSTFIGPLKEVSLRILILGGTVVLISLLAIFAVSRLLTRPLQSVVEETEKIRRFDLEGEFNEVSAIAEVQDLAQAVATMKRSLRSFSAYVPKELVRMIVSEGAQIASGGDRKQLTLMFSDIKGFSHISESLPPEAVLESLSTYFEAMSTEIHRSGGIVDKYIGDAVMAMWNAPIPDAFHIRDACRAALACRAAGQRISEQFENTGRRPYYTRFGLHTGEVVVGNVGSSDRLQYTDLGAAVNLASRLEALNKLYGTQLLVSPSIALPLSDIFLFRRLDRVVPAGTTQPIEVFELIGERDPQAEHPITDEEVARVGAWEECLTLYRKKRWEEAKAAFLRHAATWPGENTLVDLYVARCENYARNRPPADWDGAERLDKK